MSARYDIVAGIHYPHRLAQGKTAEQVAEWLAMNGYARVSERQIGLRMYEVTAIPLATYERRADTHRVAA